MAMTDRSASAHGISAFILEKGAPGFKVGKKENKLGMRCSPTGEVIFTDCRLPSSQLCGKRGEGFVDSLRILDGGRISIAALSVGLAQGAYEAALKYSKQRKQFSRFISEFQAIQHKLADMATEIDAARLLTLRAAWLKDTGASVNKESAMAKLFASESAVRVANEALQIHGGYGFIKDYPVEKFYRDVKLCTIGEGTSEIQKLVIARQLLKSHLGRRSDQPVRSEPRPSGAVNSKFLKTRDAPLNDVGRENPPWRYPRPGPRRRPDRRAPSRGGKVAARIVSAHRSAR